MNGSQRFMILVVRAVSSTKYHSIELLLLLLLIALQCRLGLEGINR